MRTHPAALDLLRDVHAIFTIRPRVPASVPDRIADEIDDVEVSLIHSADARRCLALAEEVLADGVEAWGFSGEVVKVELVATVIPDEGGGALRRPLCEWSRAKGWFPSQELLNDHELLPTVLRILAAPEGINRWGWAMLTIHAAASGSRVPAWCDDCAADDDCAWEQVVRTAMLGLERERCIVCDEWADPATMWKFRHMGLDVDMYSHPGERHHPVEIQEAAIRAAAIARRFVPETDA